MLHWLAWLESLGVWHRVRVRMDEERKLLRRRDSDPRPGQGSRPWVMGGALIQGEKKREKCTIHNSQDRKQPKCPLTGKCIKKM